MRYLVILSTIRHRLVILSKLKQYNININILQLYYTDRYIPTIINEPHKAIYQMGWW